MKKSELKTGMQVETRDGERYVVLLDTPSGDVIVKVGGNNWDELNNYNKLMLFNNKEFLKSDIVKVYSNTFSNQYLIKKMDERFLIWEREEEKVFCKLDGVEYSESTLRSLIKKATE